MRRILSVFSKIYGLMGINLLTVLILLFLINLTAKIYLQKNQSKFALQGTHIDLYGKERMHKAFDNWRPEDVDEFVPANGKYEYEPFTQYKHSEVTGKFVNVSEYGFRKNGSEQVWPPDKNDLVIFIFGGSTTFGFTRDNETIPAHLQSILRQKLNRQNISVYNFGRVGYFSSQERILFENLLLEGKKPDVAIFLDGLNDFTFFDGRPDWTKALSLIIKRKNRPDERFENALHETIDGISINQAIAHFKKQHQELPSANPPKLETEAWTPNEFGKKEIIEACINRMLGNHQVIRVLADSVHVKSLFFLQPVPTYKYDLKNHLFFMGDPAIFREARRSYFGYRSLEMRKSELIKQKDFVWLADMQNSLTKNLYVDIVHYTDWFSQEIANKIADEIILRKLAISK